MYLDVKNDSILIDIESTNLKSYQIIQLNIWGFRGNPEKNKYFTKTKSVKELLKKLLKYFKSEGLEYKLSNECENLLKKIYKKEEEFTKLRELGKKFKDGEYDSKEFNTFSNVIQKILKRKLKDHQLKAAFHLSLIKNEANFSVPGSGKTSLILSVFEKLRLEKKVNILFVVGPPSSFGPWKTEFELTLGRIPEACILAGGDINQRKSEYFVTNENIKELYLTTYQTLLNDIEEVIKFFGKKYIKPFLVIDEAHYIKQIDGLWANTTLKISNFAEFRCVLTGTPIPKSYADIFNLFDFLWPENEPINPNIKAKIMMGIEDLSEEEIRGVLDEEISPLFYRVRKSDLGLIEPNFHPPIMLEMNKYERLMYDAIEKKIRDYSKEDYLKNIDLITKLKKGRIMRLRQITSYLKLLSTSIENYPEDILGDGDHLSNIIINYDKLEKPAKLEFLLEQVEDLQAKNLKVIIWSYFIGALQLIYESLRRKNFECKIIYGQTPIESTSTKEEETREKIRDRFIDPSSGLDILIANPAACAESISLHKTCFHAIYYDLSYNCAQYLQSLDRIHRVGGSEINQANYYFYQYKDTIDKDIKNNLDKKAQRMYDLIDKDYSVYSLDMFEDDDSDIEAYNRLFNKK